VPDAEADDVIAYITKHKLRGGGEEEGATAEQQQQQKLSRIIVSNDKDFYQLLEDPTVRIYDPARKILVDQDWVLQQLGVHPKNIALARAVIGDPSDNIGGIRGVAWKTLVRHFREFQSADKDLDLRWLQEATESLLGAANRQQQQKALVSIREGRQIIERNWSLMYLDTGAMSSEQIKKIDARLDSFSSTCNRLEFIKVLTGADVPVSQELDRAFSQLKVLHRASATKTTS
jgi:5'-3' exonuclease